MAKVLLIEDDPDVRTEIRGALRDAGHEVVTTERGFGGLEQVVDASPDVVILDLGLPDVDGLDVIKMMRPLSNVPIIVATARDDETQVIRALELGADDYVIKPFSGRQLAARIMAVLRRGERGAPAPEMVVGDLRIDTRSHTATLAGKPVDLRPKEFELLAYLAGRKGELVGKRDLMTDVWDSPLGDNDKTIDVHISSLRRKLGESANDPRYIRVVRGVGVRLTEPDE